MAIDLGPIECMLGILLESWEHRYAFDLDREQQLVLFTRGGMQAVLAWWTAG